MDLPVLRTHQSSRLFLILVFPIQVINYIPASHNQVRSSGNHFIRDTRGGKKEEKKIIHRLFLSFSFFSFFIEEFSKKEFKNVQQGMYIYIYVCKDNKKRVQGGI